MSDRIEFVVNGHTMSLTRKAIEQSVKNVTPEPIRKLSVLVREIEFPVKQVFELATGLDRLDFTTAIARRNLAKLGFTIIRSEG